MIESRSKKYASFFPSGKWKHSSKVKVAQNYTQQSSEYSSKFPPLGMRHDRVLATLTCHVVPVSC